MLKSNFLQIVFFSFLFLFTSAQSEKFQLNIEFEGLSSNKGKVMIRISNAKGENVKLLSVNAESPRLSTRLNLAAGTYAVAAYHDENGNEELDTSFMGLPEEKYGFSNNARGVFGPPAISDQLFNLSANKTIKIVLK